MKQSSYTIHGRRNRWRENSLEGADENVSKKFDWYVIKKFGPYVGRYTHGLRNERHIPGEVAQDPPLLTLLFLP